MSHQMPKTLRFPSSRSGSPSARSLMAPPPWAMASGTAQAVATATASTSVALPIRIGSLPGTPSTGCNLPLAMTMRSQNSSPTRSLSVTSSGFQPGAQAVATVAAQAAAANAAAVAAVTVATAARCSSASTPGSPRPVFPLAQMPSLSGISGSISPPPMARISSPLQRLPSGSGSSLPAARRTPRTASLTLPSSTHMQGSFDSLVRVATISDVSVMTPTPLGHMSPRDKSPSPFGFAIDQAKSPFDFASNRPHRTLDQGTPSAKDRLWAGTAARHGPGDVTFSKDDDTDTAGWSAAEGLQACPQVQARGPQAAEVTSAPASQTEPVAEGPTSVNASATESTNGAALGSRSGSPGKLDGHLEIPSHLPSLPSEVALAPSEPGVSCLGQSPDVCDGTTELGTSGMVNNDSFAFSAASTAGNQQRLRSIFDRCDTKGSGRVTVNDIKDLCRREPDVAEFFGAPCQSPPRQEKSDELLQQLFKSSEDSNGERQLSWEEFCNWYVAMQLEYVRRGSMSSSGRRASRQRSGHHMPGFRPWVPAKSSRGFLLSGKSGPQGGTPISTPPRSAASTPTPRRREDRFTKLHLDAEAKALRIKEAQEQRIREEEVHARSGSKCRASSRSQSKRRPSSPGGSQNVFERGEDMLRRRQLAQAAAEEQKRIKEQSDYEEHCTFKPNLVARRSPRRRSPSTPRSESPALKIASPQGTSNSRRAAAAPRRGAAGTAPSISQAEREAEQRLRQLAHKQLDIRGRLVQLERERRRARDSIKTDFDEQVRKVQEERRRQVQAFLSGGEGLEYLRDQEEHLVKGGITREVARMQVFDELLQDAKKHTVQTVREELEPRLEQAERDFQTKCRVLLQALQDIEARARPTVEMVQGMRDGELLLNASGFTVGLAAQVAVDMATNSSRKACIDSPKAETSGRAAPIQSNAEMTSPAHEVVIVASQSSRSIVSNPSPGPTPVRVTPAPTRPMSARSTISSIGETPGAPHPATVLRTASQGRFISTTVTRAPSRDAAHLKPQVRPLSAVSPRTGSMHVQPTHHMPPVHPMQPIPPFRLTALSGGTAPQLTATHQAHLQPNARTKCEQQ